jgi:hypothetical protein
MPRIGQPAGKGNLISASARNPAHSPYRPPCRPAQKAIGNHSRAPAAAPAAGEVGHSWSMPAPITPIKKSGSGQWCKILSLSSGKPPMLVALCKGTRMLFGKHWGGNRTQTSSKFSQCSKRNSTSANSTFNVLLHLPVAYCLSEPTSLIANDKV